METYVDPFFHPCLDQSRIFLIAERKTPLLYVLSQRPESAVVEQTQVVVEVEEQWLNLVAEVVV